MIMTSSPFTCAINYMAVTPLNHKSIYLQTNCECLNQIVKVSTLVIMQKFQIADLTSLLKIKLHVSSELGRNGSTVSTNLLL